MDAFDTFRDAIRRPHESPVVQQLPVPSLRRFRFIDGGCAEILHAGDVLMGFVRIATVVFDGRKRVDQQVRTHSVVLQRGEAEVIVIEGMKRTSLPTTDSLTTALNEYRKTCECIVAREPFDGITILDGELPHGDTPNATIAIAKTTEAEARHLRAHLHVAGTWFAGDESSGYVKLHTHANHAFKVQLKNATLADLSALQAHNDPAFLGYPYGLIVADQLARISTREAGLLRIQFMTRMPAETRQALAAHDAHTVLDRMQY